VERALGEPIVVRVGGDASGMAINGRGSVQVGGTANVQNFNPNATKLVYYGTAASGAQAQDAAYVMRSAALAAAGTGLSATIAAQTLSLSQDLKALSAELALLRPLSTIASTASALDYGRAANGYAAFAMTAAAFQDQNANFDRLFANLPAGVTTVINVAGGVLNQGGNINLSSLNRLVIWNFAEATQVTVKGWHGSILALNAALTNTSAIEGSVVARSFTMNGEVHLGTCDGTSAILSAPVPEPATWAGMVAGLVLVGAALRRWRRGGRSVPAAA